MVPDALATVSWHRVLLRKPRREVGGGLCMGVCVRGSESGGGGGGGVTEASLGGEGESVYWSLRAWC